MKAIHLYCIGYFILAVNLSTSAQGNQDGRSLHQAAELGLPFIQHYSAEEYNAYTQNWGAVQDSLGLMYFANGAGVLVYNGVNWNLVELPKKSHTKCIAIDKENRIYVGASGEFGYIAPDDKGLFKYVSLSSMLPESDQDFSTIWNVLAADDGVYFRSREAIFKWENKQLKVWKSENHEFRFPFLVRNKFYVMDDTQGLLCLENNSFQLIPNGEFFKKMGVTVMLPYDEHKLLIGTLKGFFIHSDSEIVPFSNEAEDYLKQSYPYSGILLNDGSFAIATLNAGLVVIDKSGKQKLLLNEIEYLGSLEVYHLFQDKSGILWASLGNGIAKIEYPSPFTTYGYLNGDFRAFAITRYKEELHVGTDNGLFVLRQHDSGKVQFQHVHEKTDRIWDLLVYDDRLLVAWSGGLYEIYNNERRSTPSENISQFKRCLLDSNRVFISMARGFQSVYFNDGAWIPEGPVADIDGDTYSILVESSGNIWLETSEDWIWRISFENQDKAKHLEGPTLEKFGVDDGLPGERVKLLQLNEGVYCVQYQEGGSTYSYNRENNSFSVDTTLNTLFGTQHESIGLSHVDPYENALFTAFDKNGFARNYIAWKEPNGGYTIEELNESRIIKQASNSAYIDTEEKVIWYAGNYGVYRHDLNQKPIENTVNHALVNKVIYGQDSLLVAGPYHSAAIKLPFSSNVLRVEYSSTGYYDENAHLYQYYLEGFENKWSNWTSETKKDYTNIPEGHYAFRVRSKNIFGQISPESSFAFEILPPWYRTWWAYITYTLIAVLIFARLSRWRSTQLRKKNIALETLVRERTEEIAAKNSQLENKTQQLQQQTEQLKELDQMKTRLFANISHEFRTPLTLIKGPIEIAEKSPENPMSLNNIKMVRRNADRLLKLVNQLLDLSKIDSGNLKLEPTEGNTYKCLRAAASSFSSHAAQRNMDYQIKIPSTTLWTSFDRDKLEKIVYNLLSNAFKFTSDSETIIFTTAHYNNQLRIEVKDTGYGIRAERLPKIFDRFYQVDDSFTKEKEGTGIGLALTKELLDLMQGEIFVESEYGKGTLFRVFIPLEEIVPANREIETDFPFREYDADVPTITASVDDIQDKKTILIIEDHHDMRDFINQQLTDQYRTIEAFDGQDGLEKAMKYSPDLIITDLMMPQIDGITLCKSLKKNIHTSHIPVIMLTAKAGIENKLVGLETGADEYLTKPFHTLEMQVRVRNLIDQRENLKELFSKSNYIHPKEVTVNSMDEQFLQKTLVLFEEKYVDPEFGIAEMQESLSMSRAQLHRKFKAITSQTPGELLRNFRLRRAAQILEQKGESVTQVAFAVGFNNLSYFAKCFKALFGVTPSAYIKKDSTR